MKIEELRNLINDLESDCVERTISTGNTDKFGQAICLLPTTCRIIMFRAT